MANIIRSAKSGSEWTSTELNAYNITTRSQDAATFFQVAMLPQPGVDNEVLTVDVQALDLQGVDASTIEFASLLDSAMVPVGTDNLEDSAVGDFAVVLFRVTGYIDGYRFARTRKDIPLLICGEWRYAKIDVCLVDRRQSGILLLLVQEDKRQAATMLDAPAQLIAEAIAAFSYNNAIREDEGLEPLDADVRTRHFTPFDPLAHMHVVAGHTWHRHGRYISDLLQDTRNISTRLQCTQRLVPRPAYHRYFPPSRCTPTIPPAPRGNEAVR
jgi:hypothetical protein